MEFISRPDTPGAFSKLGHLAVQAASFIGRHADVNLPGDWILQGATNLVRRALWGI